MQDPDCDAIDVLHRRALSNLIVHGAPHAGTALWYYRPERTLSLNGRANIICLLQRRYIIIVSIACEGHGSLLLQGQCINCVCIFYDHHEISSVDVVPSDYVATANGKEIELKTIRNIPQLTEKVGVQ